jgi:hypothetical protein
VALSSAEERNSREERRAREPELRVLEDRSQLLAPQRARDRESRNVPDGVRLTVRNPPAEVLEGKPAAAEATIVGDRGPDMSASGGAEGVGRAENETVVLAFTMMFTFDYVFTQTLLATHPNVLVIK